MRYTTGDIAIYPFVLCLPLPVMALRGLESELPYSSISLRG
jgi:hypothetical protein